MVVFRDFLVWPSFTFEFIVEFAVSCYIVSRYIESIRQNAE